MKLKIIAFLTILSIFSPCTYSDETSHKAAAEELLILTKVDTMMKPMWEQIELLMKQQYQKINTSKEATQIFNDYAGKMVKIMEEEFGWQKMKDDFINIYINTYTEEEIRGISDFYKSPVGKIFIEKMPQLMQESMAISQKNMPAIMAKVEELTKAMENDIKKLNEQKSPAPQN